MSTNAIVKHVSVEKAIGAYLEWQCRLRYAKRTMNRFRQCCMALQTFAHTRQATRLTTDLIREFFVHEGISEEAVYDNMTHWQRDLRRTMWALREFTQHGHVPDRKKQRHIPPGWKISLSGYLHFSVEHRGLAASTLRGREREIARFAIFLHDHGATTPKAITAGLISEFLLSLAHYQGSTLSFIVGVLRSFFSYLVMSGLTTEQWADQLAHIHPFHAERLPAIWRPEEVDAMLTAVDRSSPVGKRDFAILLLAARMGMRAGEIRTLRLDHLHWEDACISFVQSKTGVAQTLPLTQEVGDALVDYLRNGRPKTQHREVFLSSLAPFAPFHYCNNLMKIVTKYRRQAGIHFPPDRKRGMHSLRHTVASRLLEIGVGFETISGILGHTSLKTTRQYTHIDLDALRAVALTPEEVQHD